MKLFVGLGNPESNHEFNRHNAGFLFIEFLATKKDLLFKKEEKFNAEICTVTLNKEKYIFVRPLLFMNNSGEVVRSILNFYKIKTTDLTVIHDDLDIALGEYKIQKGIGPKKHNGILSIEKALKSKNFTRIRVGIESREENKKIKGEDYVLMNFSKSETEVLFSIFEKITNSINI